MPPNAKTFAPDSLASGQSHHATRKKYLTPLQPPKATHPPQRCGSVKVGEKITRLARSVLCSSIRPSRPLTIVFFSKVAGALHHRRVTAGTASAAFALSHSLSAFRGCPLDTRVQNKMSTSGQNLLVAIGTKRGTAGGFRHAAISGQKHISTHTTRAPRTQENATLEDKPLGKCCKLSPFARLLPLPHRRRVGGREGGKYLEQVPRSSPSLFPLGFRALWRSLPPSTQLPEPRLWSRPFDVLCYCECHSRSMKTRISWEQPHGFVAISSNR